MDKMRMESENIQQENVAKIAALFPNCVTETRDENGHLKKVINFELLKQMLSDSIIDGDEAYEFTWVGKKASIVEANRPLSAKLCVRARKKASTGTRLRTSISRETTSKCSSSCRKVISARLR